jgi:tetratricopeptide (TPR) repeat protein
MTKSNKQWPVIIKYFSRISMLALAILVGANISAFAQETFRNPALEDDEFGKVFSNARNLARSGDFEAALKEFQNAANMKNGECAQCFVHIGQIYLQTGRYAESATAFRQAIALKPPNEAALNNALGVALYKIGDNKSLEEAAVAFRRAVELSGGKLAKAQYQLGQTLLQLGKQEEGLAALKAYIEANPSAPDVEQARRLMAKPALARLNLAPDFKVLSIKGEQLSLEKYRGKIILLDFWATWCGPCIYEMPELKKIWKKYGGDNFVIIGISFDNSQRTLESYIEKEGITWPQYFEGRTGGSLAMSYGVEGIPHTVLIDQDGAIHAIGLRGGRLSGKIGDLIKQIQKQPGTSSDEKK